MSCGGPSVNLKVKSDSALKLFTKSCHICDGSETLHDKTCHACIRNTNGLQIKHKIHVDDNLTYRLKHSLIRKCSNRSHSNDKMNIDPSTAVSQRWQSSTCRSNGSGNTNGKDGDCAQNQGKMGRNVNGCSSSELSSVPVRAEPRFERFLMTGDMIIKTTNVPALSRLDRNKHQDESKVSEELVGIEEEQRISPLSLPPPPLLSDHPLSCDTISFQGTSEVSRILPDVVQNDFFDGDRTENAFPCHHLEATCVAVWDGGNRCPAEPTTSTKLELLGCCRYPDIPIELDIPPDDISSEDERYRTEELNMDDLPPPPVEFLADFVMQQVSSSCSLDKAKEESCYYDQIAKEAVVLQPKNTHDICLDVVLDGSNALFAEHSGVLELEKEPCGRINIEKDISASPAVAKSGIICSRSEEKLSPRMVSDKSKFSKDIAGFVRGSKSQENCLQCDSDGVVIDIDFGERIATSVDTLHYQNSCPSVDGLGFTQGRAVQSLHNTPEKRNQMENQETVFVVMSSSLQESKLKKEKSTD